jgi:hypothetical protein
MAWQLGGCVNDKATAACGRMNAASASADEVVDGSVRHVHELYRLHLGAIVATTGRLLGVSALVATLPPSTSKQRPKSLKLMNSSAEIRWRKGEPGCATNLECLALAAEQAGEAVHLAHPGDPAAPPPHTRTRSRLEMLRCFNGLWNGSCLMLRAVVDGPAGDEGQSERYNLCRRSALHEARSLA